MLLALGVMSPVYADDILKCLGEEEKRIHVSKKSGPQYELNQKLISEILQIPNVRIHNEYFKKICGSKFVNPSLKLLELSLINGKSIFKEFKTTNEAQNSMTSSMMDGYVEATKEIFLEFIASIQTLSPTPSCLKEEIPSLDKFLTEVKYLQEDIDLKILLNKKDIKLFKELKSYPQAFERCRLLKSKKDKSESTEAAKKS